MIQRDCVPCSRKLDSYGGEMRALDSGGVLTLEDWARIRRLAVEGVPKVVIAARWGLRTAMNLSV